ncbi:hypothetical protein Lal_00027026 [Lupinus albus]|nr:hypothetical protein Lal_00027026 [Lupinus albus]
MEYVKLADNWGDCGEFQSLRLSCSHAIATCISLALDYGQFISPIYRQYDLLKAYGYEFQPIGPTFIFNHVMRRKRAGRPKITHIRKEMDEVQPEQGHNRKACPLRFEELGESSRQPSDNQ